MLQDGKLERGPLNVHPGSIQPGWLPMDVKEAFMGASDGQLNKRIDPLQTTSPSFKWPPLRGSSSKRLPIVYTKRFTCFWGSVRYWCTLRGLVWGPICPIHVETSAPHQKWSSVSLFFFLSFMTWRCLKSRSWFWRLLMNAKRWVFDRIDVFCKVFVFNNCSTAMDCGYKY